MKTIYKNILLVLFCSTLFVNCSVEENPPTLSEDNVYTSIAGMEAALNGVYSGLAQYNYFVFRYHELVNQTAGMYYSNSNNDIITTVSLNVSPNDVKIETVWAASYQTIARANILIAKTPDEITDPQMLNLLGQAYFLRAYTYFNLVRMYGGVPLRLDPATSETLHLAKSSASEVYESIIADAEKAKLLLFDKGSQTEGRPANTACNMLLAKVYMTLAGDDNGSEYWTKAHSEALVAYGQYSLVSDYTDLWGQIGTANNNSESIFEIQFNTQLGNSSYYQIFSPANYGVSRGWERVKANPEVIDLHLDTYPSDPRIDVTYLLEFTYEDKKRNKIKTKQAYPLWTKTRNKGTGFPWIFKYTTKDRNQISSPTDFNFVVYRYADLLLMLGEIENELGQTTDAISRVNEVLTRARMSGDGSEEPADWFGLSQDEFREAIMKEYRFELVGEGHDFYNNRRRGWDYFKTNFVDVHNNYKEAEGVWQAGLDVLYPDNSRIMLMPLPASEINANQLLLPTDQNPGY